MNAAVGLFDQAVARDPTFALAKAGLADTYGLLGDYTLVAPKEAFPKSKTAALEAIAIDEGLVEAHVSLAYALSTYDWDWSSAEREFKRAIELNPSYATAHHWYARHLTRLGRFDEARTEISRAAALDPRAPYISANIGEVEYFAGRSDRAVDTLRKLTDEDPQFARGHHALGLAYLEQRRLKEGIAELQTAANLLAGDGTVAALGYAYATAGDTAEAWKILAEMQARATREFVSPYLIAPVMVGLGEREQAIRELDEAYRVRDSWLTQLAVDPKFASLRADPRVGALPVRMGMR